MMGKSHKTGPIEGVCQPIIIKIVLRTKFTRKSMAKKYLNPDMDQPQITGSSGQEIEEGCGAGSSRQTSNPERGSQPYELSPASPQDLDLQPSDDISSHPWQECHVRRCPKIVSRLSSSLDLRARTHTHTNLGSERTQQ